MIEEVGGCSSSLMDSVEAPDVMCGREEMGSTFKFSKFDPYFYSQRAF
jgi:hypothetical protein